MLVGVDVLSSTFTHLLFHLARVEVKDTYQAFWGVLIELIIGFLGLIIKAFDNQTESWA
jgi:hypothetical protein